jgi:GDP-L-fucose synthase
MPEMLDGIEGRRVLVSGGTGFLGRYVCEQVRAAGASALMVPRRAEFDLIRPGDADRLLRETQPDTVIHLAAEVGGIGANRGNPGRFLYANLAMGIHLIEAARVHGVQKFVQAGTVCSYPKWTPVPFHETDLWSGYPEETNAPYGIAKKTLLVMLQAYREQYGLNGIYLMPVNLYGPGDDFDPKTSHVIPALIRRFEWAARTGASRVTCWGTGGASREFLYVEDCARGFVRAARSYDDPEPVNLGSGVDITIRELAERIARIVGFHGQIDWDASQPDGQPRRRLDVSRAEQRFGFRAQIALDDGLARTVAWYRRMRASQRDPDVLPLHA